MSHLMQNGWRFHHRPKRLANPSPKPVSTILHQPWNFLWLLNRSISHSVCRKFFPIRMKIFLWYTSSEYWKKICLVYDNSSATKNELTWVERKSWPGFEPRTRWAAITYSTTELSRHVLHPHHWFVFIITTLALTLTLTLMPKATLVFWQRVWVFLSMYPCYLDRFCFSFFSRKEGRWFCQ